MIPQTSLTIKGSWHPSFRNCLGGSIIPLKFTQASRPGPWHITKVEAHPRSAQRVTVTVSHSTLLWAQGEPVIILLIVVIPTHYPSYIIIRNVTPFQTISDLPRSNYFFFKFPRLHSIYLLPFDSCLTKWGFSVMSHISFHHLYCTITLIYIIPLGNILSFYYFTIGSSPLPCDGAKCVCNEGTQYLIIFLRILSFFFFCCYLLIAIESSQFLVYEKLV